MLPNLLHAYIGAEEVGDETHYTYNDVWTSFAKDALGSVFLWAAIALAVILIAVGVFVRFKKQESFGRFVKTAIALAVGFAVTVIVTMLALEFYDIYENGYVFDMVLWPTVAFGIVLVASVAAAYVCSLFSQKNFQGIPHRMRKPVRGGVHRAHRMPRNLLRFGRRGGQQPFRPFHGKRFSPLSEHGGRHHRRRAPHRVFRQGRKERI